MSVITSTPRTGSATAGGGDAAVTEVAASTAAIAATSRPARDVPRRAVAKCIDTPSSTVVPDQRPTTTGQRNRHHPLETAAARPLLSLVAGSTGRADVPQERRRHADLTNSWHAAVSPRRRRQQLAQIVNKIVIRLSS